MLRPSNHIPVVYLCRDVVDFRKGINGLAILVEDSMSLNPFSEQLFIFCNRKRDKLRILYWERNGFCLWQKHLEKEKFKWPRKTDPPHPFISVSQCATMKDENNQPSKKGEDHEQDYCNWPRFGKKCFSCGWI